MPTDMVKLLAIISVLNVPGNASKSLCTACELHKQCRSAALRWSLDREAALSGAPTARPRVTVVKFLGCHLCDGAVDGSSDGAVACLEASFGAVVELLAGDHVWGELGRTEDSHLVVGRLADAEESC